MNCNFVHQGDIYVVYTFLAAVLWMSCTLPEKIFSATESSVKFRRSGSTYLQNHGIFFVYIICLVFILFYFFVYRFSYKLCQQFVLNFGSWFSGSASLDKLIS